MQRPAMMLADKPAKVTIEDLLKSHDDDIVASGSIICWTLARSIADYEQLYDRIRPSEVYHLLSIEIAQNEWRRRNQSSSN